MAASGLPPDVVEHYSADARGWHIGQSFELLTRVWPGLDAGPLAQLSPAMRNAVVDASFSAFRKGIGPGRLADSCARRWHLWRPATV
jgi:hypothetical protein